jgi:hypothetical protein
MSKIMLRRGGSSQAKCWSLTCSWADLVRAQSDVLNHFVMQLPVEEPNPSLLESIVMQTRISLKLAGESLGVGKRDEE